MQGGMQYCRTLYPLLPYTPLLGGLAAGLLPHTHRSKITLLGGLAAGLRPLSSPYGEKRTVHFYTKHHTQFA